MLREFGYDNNLNRTGQRHIENRAKEDEELAELERQQQKEYEEKLAKEAAEPKKKSTKKKKSKAPAPGNNLRSDSHFLSP